MLKFNFQFLGLRIFFIFLVIFVFHGVAFAQFSDVDEEFVDYLSDHKIFEGFPDQTFEPNRFLNRAELMKIVMVGNSEALIDTEAACFPDIPVGEWFSDFVCTAKNEGLVHGYPDGSFRPEEPVNKVEALKMIANVFHWDLYPNLTDSFEDTFEGQWYFGFVVNGLNHGYIDMNSEKMFKPAEFITRKDAAEILFRTIVDQKVGGGLVKTDLEVAVRNLYRLEDYSKSLTKDDLDTVGNFEDFDYGYKILMNVPGWEKGALRPILNNYIFLYKYEAGTENLVKREFHIFHNSEAAGNVGEINYGGIDANGLGVIKSIVDGSESVIKNQMNVYSFDLVHVDTKFSGPDGFDFSLEPDLDPDDVVGPEDLDPADEIGPDDQVEPDPEPEPEPSPEPGTQLSFESDFFQENFGDALFPLDLSDIVMKDTVNGEKAESYKLATALYMLGYTYYHSNNPELHLEMLEKFQRRHGYSVSEVLSEEVALAIDEQLADFEEVFDGYADKFYPLFKNMDPDVEDNVFPEDYIAWIFIAPIEALPDNLQIKTMEEMQHCIAGQCVGSINNVDGTNIFDPDVFYGKSESLFPKHASAQVFVIVHEYAHYLDAFARSVLNDELYPHKNMLDTVDFYGYSYDYRDEVAVDGMTINGWTVRCYPLKNGLESFIAYYGFDRVPATEGECPEGMSGGQFEDFAESFAAYVAAGNDFGVAAGQNSVLALKYAFLRDHVFEGVEYDTEMVDINQLYSGCLDGDEPRYGPGYLSCDDGFVWDGEFRKI